MNNMMYLLTGAAGFLGSNISRALVARGSRVRALVLKDDPASKMIPAEVEKITGDLLDCDSLESFFDVPSDADLIVLHIASFVTVVPEWNQKVYEVNVTGTKNIIEKCLKHKAKKLVYVSSTGAIPETSPGQIEEPDSFDPALVLGCYAKTKAMATQAVLDAARENGLNASIVYPSGICGPNDFAYGFVAQFILNYTQGKMPAGIAGSFNSVDVRDLAEGIIACAAKGRKGEGYIMSNSCVGIKELFHLISKHTGSPEVKIILPIPLARFVAFISETAARLMKKSTMFTTYSVYNLARNNNFDCSKAMMELGYQCRPFEETIQDTIRWLEAEGKVTIAPQKPVMRLAPVPAGE
jgi:dihydroflavonol-4-reductase